MRSMTPRPFVLMLTLLLIVGAIAAIEMRFGVAGSGKTQQDNRRAITEDRTGASEGGRPRDVGGRAVRPASSEEGMEHKETKFRRAEEIVAPAGFINTDGVSIKEARGEKVILVDFWTYACYNCQNTQPYLNAWHDEYADDGLLIIGVHTPEFGFERDPANVERAVREAGIEEGAYEQTEAKVRELLAEKERFEPGSEELGSRVGTGERSME